MTTNSIETSQPPVQEVAKRARASSRSLARLSNEHRNEILMAAASALESGAQKILNGNERDCRAAQLAVEAGKMSAAMFARLRVKAKGIEEMAARVRDVARLPDPLGRRLAATELDDGLVLHKESCPLGVVGIVFESRPDVIPQVASLALKSGNALILKGGAEAAHTSEALVEVWRGCLEQFSSVQAHSVQLLHTRADVMELLTLDREVDLIIPRGSREFVEFVAKNSRVPVLGHGEGICHVYVDRAADVEKAIKITLDSKTQYPAACNAAETLLVHQDIALRFLPAVVTELRAAAVEIRGCSRTVELVRRSDITPAEGADWATEHSDLVLSVRTVSDIDEAIAHIHRYGSRHTETIVTEDGEAAKKFLEEVDAAGVFHNASTRFADGFRYGLGAELGISTGKLHARGPVGLEGLTTYKYKLFGNGQIVAEYANGTRQFKHRAIEPPDGPSTSDL
ncbi:MAG: glutamate-5-semialdehyde dehydrogenase [Acidobacteria bacterium]|nr:MAG: glutamate-5-semialdehyde dehydrogenase [Acidobacteriota bacterium]